jgi:CBS-domain-containing membrane protein
MLIRELMTAPAVTITNDTAIADALRLLDQHKITTLPVIDRHGSFLGVVSEADLVANAAQLDDRVYLSAVRVSSVSPLRRVEEVMTRLAVSVHSDDEIEVAVDLMTATTLKSLPVVDNGRVAGVISRSDIIHLLANWDDRVHGDVADLLHEEFPEWAVEVHDGVVTVTGPADERQRRLAEILAGTVRGVVAVQVR